jgi:NADH-quinone oxidoreductase subunit G
MPKLKIDGHEVEVPKGTKVISAAERLGIIIPRFCYHPGLGSVGACRLCAVKFLEGPVKGIQMSCMVDAADGMVVSTTDEEAVDYRKQVIEWLMMNHPHDCPVCDEGGHCLLQDMTVSGGHGIRRYLGKKWTYRDQYLGVFVQHEMNRCIHCWRCRRFYQDFAGYRDLGAMQIGYREYFGRASDGPLESHFSGNLIDICPTGVYTDKPSRYKGRRWDYERSLSLCIHCSLGCRLITSARYREIVRLEAGFSESVNGYFICDRGRYGFYYTNLPERPRRARVDSEDVALNQAIRTTAEKLSQISRDRGPKSIACLGSVRSSLENQAMLKYLCRMKGWQEPSYFVDSSAARKVREALARLDERLVVSLREIESADFILAVGADPVNEAPMLTLAIRQAWRNGAMVAVIDPRPVSLPFSFEHLPALPRDIDLCLCLLIKGAVDRSVATGRGSEALRFYDAIPTDHPSENPYRDRLSFIVQKLQQSKNPVIVCGTEIVRETTPGVAADSALFLKASKEKAGLFYVMSGANASGAGLLTSHDSSLTNIIEAVEEGTVKALLLVECNPFQLFPDQKRLEEAMSRLDLVIVIDYLSSRAASEAHIFLPSLTLFETPSAFINQEGRIQIASPAYCGGIPIDQTGSGGHPPRFFRNDIPGSDPRAAWEILAEIGGKVLSRDEVWQWLSQESIVPPDVRHSADAPEGFRLTLPRRIENPFSLDWLSVLENDRSSDEFLELLLVDWTFGTEELSTQSPYIQQAENPPMLFMNPRDAAKLDLNDKDRIILPLEGGFLELELAMGENMAPGVMVLPRHRQLHWQKVKEVPVKVPIDRIKKL